MSSYTGSAGITVKQVKIPVCRLGLPTNAARGYLALEAETLATEKGTILDIAEVVEQR